MEQGDITFVLPNGTKKTVKGNFGLSILEIAHTNNIFELEGACEGSLACSTCHIVVDETFFNKLKPAEEEEEDMLDLAFNVKTTSRLGCQIIFKPEINGIIVTVPQANRNFAG